MPHIELVYFPGCPNVGEARARLVQALAQRGLPARWIEWNLEDPACPYRSLGSPTVLVEGKDVQAGISPEGTVGCRIYRNSGDRLEGAPPMEAILRALPHASWQGRLNRLGPLLGLGATLLPVGICPSCWPLYAGVLSALGLGFLLQRTYVLPLLCIALGLSLFALVWRARGRRGFGPFLLGLPATGLILWGKFGVSEGVLAYVGLTLLLLATAWNAWPRQPIPDESCPSCSSTSKEPERSLGSIT